MLGCPVPGDKSFPGMLGEWLGFAGKAPPPEPAPTAEPVMKPAVAPTPPTAGWVKEYNYAAKQPYWRNAITGETTWEQPAEPLEYASSCYLPTSFLDLPLLQKQEYNHDTSIYTFKLPEGHSLNLPVCACLLLKAPGRGRGPGGKDDWDGSDAVRPYTPMSDNSMLGKFQLLVKRYDGGAVSQYLHGLEPGAMVGFKHIKFNIKAQYPFEGKKTISMLCAGTGLTPMFQALWKLLGTPGDDRQVVLMYGNKSVEDILLKEELDAWSRHANGRLKLVHVVGSRPDEPAPPGWVDTPEYIAETGWVDQAKSITELRLEQTSSSRSSHIVCPSHFRPHIGAVQKYCFPPAEDTLLFVCGLPPMYNALCGPRTEKELKEGTVLHSLGYTTDRWLKVASTLSEDTVPPARLVAPKAQAASTEPRAQAEQLEGLPWPQ